MYFCNQNLKDKKMKKLIFLCLTSLLLSCNKESETDSKTIDFMVNVENDNLSEKPVNEPVRLYFDISTQSNLERTPLKYRIETSLRSTIRDDKGIEISKNNSYDYNTLREPELILYYTGLEEGKHIMKIHFFKEQGQEVVKEVNLRFRVYKYKLQIRNGKETPNQGEDVDFDLELEPNSPNGIDIPYYITFKKYGYKDDKLEKNFISLDGRKIAFGNEYKIQDISNIKIRINSYYAGYQELEYVIKNKTFEESHTIKQDVQENQIEIEGTPKVDSKIVNVNDVLIYSAKVIKKPKVSNDLQYKLEIISGYYRGLTENDWKDVVLRDNGNVYFPIEVLKVGDYEIRVTFRDEFGNEKSVDTYIYKEEQNGI